MNFRPALFLILLFFTALSCDNALCCDDDRIKNRQFTNWGAYEHTGQLRLNGVYVDLEDDSTVNHLIILYEDGIMYGVDQFCQNITLDSAVIDFCSIESERSRLDSWGAFGISGEEFLIQHVIPSPTFSELPVSETMGMIINDSTFMLSGFRKHRKGNWSMFSEFQLFSFVELENKPDSNCVLIGQLGAPEDQ